MRAALPRFASLAAFALAALGPLSAPGAATADEPPKAPAPPGPPPPAAPSPPAGPTADDLLSEERLKAFVAFLASPDLRGRGSEPMRHKAADAVAKALEEAGAVPVPGRRGFLVDFAGDVPGRNVAGWIPGTDPEEYVIASAHYDHLGVRAGMVHPGADDNASGVAALVETTRALAHGAKPRRSVMVVSFDLEEDDCRGSRAFAADPPLPLARCATFVTADMLGRSLADFFPGLLLMGDERAEALAAAVDGVRVPEGVSVRRLGMDFNSLGWSDYVPFQERKVPSLFLSSGACRDYHRPGDVPEKIDGPALAARATFFLRLVRALAEAPARPSWIESPPPRLAEIEAILDLVRRGGEKEADLGIPEGARPIRRQFQVILEGIVARGKVTEGERTSVRTMALLLLGYLTNQPR